MSGQYPHYWALTQYVMGADGSPRSVAHDYGYGGLSPRWPDGLTEAKPDETGQIAIWGLVLVHDLHHEAAEQDPRVQPYYSIYDTITPETATAYAAQGAKPDMALFQLLALLAKSERAWRHAIHI